MSARKHAEWLNAVEKVGIGIETADTVSGLSRKTMIGFAGKFLGIFKTNR